MKAPEKIYLWENPVSEEPDDRWLLHRSCDDDVEYIQTDAFMKKACEWLTYNNDLIDGDVADYVDDFRNYMKGE